MVKWAWVSNRSGQRFRRTGLLVDVGAVGKKCLEMGNLVLEFFKFLGIGVLWNLEISTWGSEFGTSCTRWELPVAFNFGFTAANTVFLYMSDSPGCGVP